MRRERRTPRLLWPAWYNTPMKIRPLFLIAAALACVAACVPSSHVLVGKVREPIAPADVKIYSHAPPRFEEVAVLSASSKSVFAPGGQRAIDKVVERLKEQAAKLGANGIVLEDFSDRETGSLGTGVGSSSYSRNSAVGLGVGGSLGIFSKTGKARAIYVAPGTEIQPPQAAPAP